MICVEHNWPLFCVQIIQISNLFQSQYHFLYLFFPSFIIEIYYEMRIVYADFPIQILMYDASISYFNSIPSYYKYFNIISIKIQCCGKYLLPLTKLQKTNLKLARNIQLLAARLLVVILTQSLIE